MDREIDRIRPWAYLLVALAGFLAGVAVGELGAVRRPGSSRIDWPSPAVPRPRTIGP